MNTSDPKAAIRTVCETTVEEILRDAAQLGWELAGIGADLDSARAMAVTEAHESIVGIVGQILLAGAAIEAAP